MAAQPKRESARSLFASAKRLINPPSGRPDYRSAFQLLKCAAAIGHPGAHEWLGFVYDYGIGTRPNRRLSFEHYKIASAAGCPNAEYHVGVFYYYQAAMKWLRRAARHGDSTAVYWIGHCYLHGRGAPKNERKGFSLVLSAANTGVLEA